MFGRKLIRTYWTSDGQQFDPHEEPMELFNRGGGKTHVRVHRLAKSLAGDVLSDIEACDVHTIAKGLIESVDIDESEATPPRPKSHSWEVKQPTSELNSSLRSISNSLKSGSASGGLQNEKESPKTTIWGHFFLFSFQILFQLARALSLLESEGRSIVKFRACLPSPLTTCKSIASPLRQ